MAFLTSGGSLVTSSSIVDGEIINDDISAAAAISQSKIAPTTNANTDLIAIETSDTGTLSLTTVAGQKVVVFATVVIDGGVEATTSLLYNGVSKDAKLGQSASANEYEVTLMYTETPGAATADITVSSTDTILESRIIAFKFK